MWERRRRDTPRARGPLLGNRDFRLLWTGDVLSELGSQATNVAMPLLVLALTGSPAKAGLTGLARSLAYPLAPLPAGVLADRVSRRAIMVVCSIGRAIVMGSVVAALALGRPSLAQLMVVAFTDAVLWSAAGIAERGLLPHVVASGELADAVAVNQAREALGTVGGPPLGGALFQAGRALPFLGDAVSFAFVVLAVLGIRTRPVQGRSERAGVGVWAEVREGATWLWHQPFLRAGALLYAAANVNLAAVELLAILVARHHHASPAEIGAALAIAGVGGVVGAVIAGPVRRRLPARAGVLIEPWFTAVFVPCLLLCRSAFTVGLVVALDLLPIALSSSIVVGRRLALTPDALRGRVQASSAFIAGSIIWIGPPVVGYLFQEAGETVTVITVAAWALLVALLATASPGLRRVPEALSSARG